MGKTTLLLELAERLGNAAIYVAADGPEATLPGFWERLWVRAEETAARAGRAVVLLDEAHLLSDWSGRLKGEWDRLRRRKRPVHVVATCSSALRLAAGARESLAGRFERITLTHWSASSLAEVFGVPPVEAPELLVRMGCYPGAFEPSRPRALVGVPSRRDPRARGWTGHPGPCGGAKASAAAPGVRRVRVIPSPDRVLADSRSAPGPERSGRSLITWRC
ncbi:MAG: AAA family ATPase [Proteobacteria bacterium]|nr:AAA family ATPase [Pseudomonadota bacterium]